MVHKAISKNGVVILPPGLLLPAGPVEVRVSTPVELRQEHGNGAACQQGEPLSVFDFSPISVGAVLRPFPADDDILAEMIGP